METVEHILQARKDLKETCLGFGKNGAGDEDDEYYYGKRIDDNYLWLAAEFRHGRKMKENRCKKKASLKILAQLAPWRVLGIDKLKNFSSVGTVACAWHRQVRLGYASPQPSTRHEKE